MFEGMPWQFWNGAEPNPPVNPPPWWALVLVSLVGVAVFPALTYLILKVL